MLLTGRYIFRRQSRQHKPSRCWQRRRYRFFLHPLLVHYILSLAKAMALSASSTPATWNRTLPMPTGLQSREMLELARRNSTLLQHHISSDQFLDRTVNDTTRRSIAAYSSLAQKCEQDKSMGDDDRSTHRSVSVMSSESISTSSSDGLTSQERSGGICICPGESRIPRPRNGK